MKNTIKPFLDRLGITPYRFWHDTGISRVTAYKLYNEPDYIPGADVLVKICDTYQVQPGAILLWTPEEEGDKQNLLGEQGQQQNPEQNRNLDESNPHRHQLPRSLVIVIPEIAESA